MSFHFEPFQKINGLYKRDGRGRFIEGDFALPEFEFLFDNDWIWTEKVDGTNIRLAWEPTFVHGNEHAYIAGRSDEAQIPPFLLAKLIEILRDRVPLFEAKFPGASGVCLYGEGYGAKIQKGGGDYIPNGTDFVLFDVALTTGDGSRWWMTRDAVVDIADALKLDVVQTVATCSVRDAITLVRERGFESAWEGVSQPEGLVGRPVVDLWSRKGERITTKLKWKDLGSQ